MFEVKAADLADTHQEPPVLFGVALVPLRLSASRARDTTMGFFWIIPWSLLLESLGGNRAAVVRANEKRQNVDDAGLIQMEEWISFPVWSTAHLAAVSTDLQSSPLLQAHPGKAKDKIAPRSFDSGGEFFEESWDR